MKKILLTTGVAVATITPIIAVVSCGSNDTFGPKSYTVKSIFYSDTTNKSAEESEEISSSDKTYQEFFQQEIAKAKASKSNDYINNVLRPKIDRLELQVKAQLNQLDDTFSHLSSLMGGSSSSESSFNNFVSSHEYATEYHNQQVSSEQARINGVQQYSPAFDNSQQNAYSQQQQIAERNRQSGAQNPPSFSNPAADAYRQRQQAAEQATRYGRSSTSLYSQEDHYATVGSESDDYYNSNTPIEDLGIVTSSLEQMEDELIELYKRVHIALQSVPLTREEIEACGINAASQTELKEHSS